MASLWISNFGDNYGRGASPRFFGTVQPADVDDDAAGTEFCGLGHAGILCSTNEDHSGVEVAFENLRLVRLETVLDKRRDDVFRQAAV